MRHSQQPPHDGDHPHHHHDHDHPHSHAEKSSGLVTLGALTEATKARKKSINIEELREKLAAGRGPAFWRTLDEAAESEDLREYMEQEFPGLSGRFLRVSTGGVFSR